MLMPEGFWEPSADGLLSEVDELVSALPLASRSLDLCDDLGGNESSLFSCDAVARPDGEFARRESRDWSDLVIGFNRLFLQSPVSGGKFEYTLPFLAFRVRPNLGRISVSLIF